MERSIVNTAEAPAAIGPYSQAVVVTTGAVKMVFCSGQIAIDPVTNQMMLGDIGQQAERVLINLEAVLAEAGATFAHVVKTTIYLADMLDFTVVNEHYAKRFTEAPPARATVQAAGLPKNALVEIDCIAVVPS